MRLMMSTVAAFALIVVATSIMWPRAHLIELSTAAMPSLDELHRTASADRIPVQDIDDQSLLYPTETKR
jgi:hypothetical protein